jgi:uncharacterized membrane protein YoaK (UPF0700 family)
MISILVELAIGIAVVAVILLLGKFCRQHSFTPPPSRLPFIAVLLTTIFNILIAGRDNILPNSFIVAEAALKQQTS